MSSSAYFDRPSVSHPSSDCPGRNSTCSAKLIMCWNSCVNVIGTSCFAAVREWMQLSAPAESATME